MMTILDSIGIDIILIACVTPTAQANSLTPHECWSQCVN